MKQPTVTVRVVNLDALASITKLLSERNGRPMNRSQAVDYALHQTAKRECGKVART